MERGSEASARESFRETAPLSTVRDGREGREGREGRGSKDSVQLLRESNLGPSLGPSPSPSLGPRDAAAGSDGNRSNSLSALLLVFRVPTCLITEPDSNLD